MGDLCNGMAERVFPESMPPPPQGEQIQVLCLRVWDRHFSGWEFPGKDSRFNWTSEPQNPYRKNRCRMAMHGVPCSMSYSYTLGLGFCEAIRGLGQEHGTHSKVSNKTFKFFIENFHHKSSLLVWPPKRNSLRIISRNF